MLLQNNSELPLQAQLTLDQVVILEGMQPLLNDVHAVYDLLIYLWSSLYYRRWTTEKNENSRGDHLYRAAVHIAVRDSVSILALLDISYYSHQYHSEA